MDVAIWEILSEIESENPSIKKDQGDAPTDAEMLQLMLMI